MEVHPKACATTDVVAPTYTPTRKSSLLPFLSPKISPDERLHFVFISQVFTKNFS